MAQYNEQLIVDRSGDWTNPLPTIGGESLVIKHSENGRSPGVTFMNDGGGHFVHRFTFAANSNLPGGEAANLYVDWHGLRITGHFGMSFSIGPLANASPIEHGKFIFANADVSVRDGLVVEGGVSIAKDLVVDGDVAFHKGLVVDGDIVLSNADCAEEFDTHEGDEVTPGMVVVLTPDGRVTKCSNRYDSNVIGVVSGAGSYNPAVLLDHREGSKGRVPVGLLGKVFCWVDASYDEVKPGDMLTTSPTPGHAMRATDSLRTRGAIIGKALRGLRHGRNLIPILISSR